MVVPAGRYVVPLFDEVAVRWMTGLLSGPVPGPPIPIEQLRRQSRPGVHQTEESVAIEREQAARRPRRDGRRPRYGRQETDLAEDFPWTQRPERDRRSVRAALGDLVRPRIDEVEAIGDVVLLDDALTLADVDRCEAPRRGLEADGQDSPEHAGPKQLQAAWIEARGEQNAAGTEDDHCRDTEDSRDDRDHGKRGSDPEGIGHQRRCECADDRGQTPGDLDEPHRTAALLVGDESLEDGREDDVE